MCYLYMEISCYLGEIMLSGAVLVGFLIGDLGHYLISLRSGLLDEIKKCKIICSMYVCMHVITAFWLSNIEVLCSSLDLQSLSEIKCVTKLFLSRHKRSKNNMYWKVIHQLTYKYLFRPDSFPWHQRIPKWLKGLHKSFLFWGASSWWSKDDIGVMADWRNELFVLASTS